MDRLLTINQVLERSTGYLPYSRETLYREMNAGRLESLVVGRRRFVPESAIARYIDLLRREQQAAQESELNEIDSRDSRTLKAEPPQPSPARHREVNPVRGSSPTLRGGAGDGRVDR
jgi:hypothetical protein